MSAQDLNRVHRRYIVVSNTFKSAWTFHQFIQGLRKVFPEVPAVDYPADFQSVYGDLKRVSENLSETSLDTARGQLDHIDQQLQPLVQELLNVDERVSPGKLRQFFQRVKHFEDNILTQLVKFYLYSRQNGRWNPDHIDKADFLSTKVAEEYNDSRVAFMLRDRTQLRELAQGFWSALGVAAPAEAEVDAWCAEIKNLEQEIRTIDSIDELHQHSLIQRYRELKHSLGDIFFQPRVWHAVLEANLVLKNHIQQLYRRDEQRIIAEYQHVFELERDVPVDVQLGEELSQFRDAVERFEDQLQGENVRVAELAQLREKVRELVPKLQPSSDDEDTLVVPVEAREDAPVADVSEADLEEEIVAECYKAIVGALDDTNPTIEPKKIALQPEIFSLGLGPREVVAYRRLFSGATCDRSLEQFILRSAALRALVEQQVEEIKGILDDTAATREAPVYKAARQTVRLGDLFLRRFEHRLEQTILSGDGQEARALQVLKMRMMRAYSGLWLLIYRN
ncbi:MAG: hypothetical protein AAF657_07810 [Acidobacteriota bacterium]